MATKLRELKIKDCGNTHCDPYVGCKGHRVGAEYQTTVDVGSVYIDGEYIFGGGDTLLGAVSNIINDLFADQPKYIVTPDLPLDIKGENK